MVFVRLKTKLPLFCTESLSIYKDVENHLKAGYVAHCIVTEESFGNFLYPFSCTDPFFSEMTYPVAEAPSGTPCVTTDGKRHPNNVSIVKTYLASRYSNNSTSTVQQVFELKFSILHSLLDLFKDVQFIPLCPKRPSHRGHYCWRKTYCRFSNIIIIYYLSFKRKA